MVTDFKQISEVVDNATYSRQVSNAIRADLVRIYEEIAKNGYAEVVVGGKKFKVKIVKRDSVKESFWDKLFASSGQK